MNYRYLESSEKDLRMRALHKSNCALQMRLQRLEVKLSDAVEKCGVLLDQATSEDIKSMMEDGSRLMKGVEEVSFQHILADAVKSFKERREREKWCTMASFNY